MNILAANKIDVARLDNIIKKTIESIDSSKSEIGEIAENARKECKLLENELEQLKIQVKSLIENCDQIENELKDSKRNLMLVNKNYLHYSQEDLKSAYEKADKLRVQLAVKREQEQFFIKRRNDLEMRIRQAYITLEKAESLYSKVGKALNFLTGDLMEISVQLEDMQQKQLLGLKVIKAQEDERQRVAKEIHDGPAQLLSNIFIKAEICEKLMCSDVEKAKEELHSLKKVVRESLQDVRKIIYDLRPMSLDDLGLIPTLQRFIANYQENSGIMVSFKTRGVFDKLKSVISLTVYRIVQEAVNNIDKHSDANGVMILLEENDGQLKLNITDDGKGFDTKKLKLGNDDITGGFGLCSMQERVELLNGEFKIISEPGRGTRLNIIIPFIQEEGVTNG